MRFFKERLPKMPPVPLGEVIASVTAGGRWSRNQEWRISTVTSTEISATGEPERHRAYRVRVECDSTFEAHCPTIERTIEVAERYETLVVELWSSLGWPSWASRRELEPPAGAPDRGE